MLVTGVPDGDWDFDTYKTTTISHFMLSTIKRYMHNV